MNINSTITHEDIAQRAHEIWEKAGRPEGQEAEHWFQAENELREEQGHAKQVAPGAGNSKPGRSAGQPAPR